MTELLTFEQRLRMECFKMTLDVEKAQEAYDYILGSRRAHQPVGEEPSEDTDRFLTDYPFTNLLEDEGLSIRANNILRVNEIATLGELCGWPRYGIIRLQNLGKKTFQQLEHLLERYHLTWGMWESPSYLRAEEKRRKRLERHEL